MKVAVIGTWHVHTKEYAEAIKNNPLSTLACCWDDNEERGRAFAGEMDIPFVKDISDIWNDKSIDSIQVTTATAIHKDILISAAKSGKNIFTEKVLALTNEDAQEIKDAVEKSGKVFTISFPHRTFPALLAAKEILDSGALGEITYARAHNYHDGSIAGWLPDTFYDANETGGGAMIDLGAHPMYCLKWFLGNPVSMVSMFTSVTKRPVEDNAVTVIELENGAIGVSETGFVTTGNPHIIELSGTLGSLLVHYGKIEYCSKKTTDSQWVSLDKMPEKLPLPVDQWIDSVVNAAPVTFGIDDAVSLTEFMTGAYEAHKAGKKYIF